MYVPTGRTTRHFPPSPRPPHTLPTHSQLFTSCHAPAGFTNARTEHAALLNKVLAPKNPKDSTHNALFLHGPPGSGKTALTTATLRNFKYVTPPPHTHRHTPFRAGTPTNT